MKDRIEHVPLGRIDYVAALAAQRCAHACRSRGEIRDLVLTAEHDPVLTVGRSGSLDDLLVSPEQLREEGIPVHRVERGGGITYHGPGQLVVYPILDLKERGLDLRRYVRLLEDAMLATARAFGVRARRDERRPGAWVGSRKLASVGIHVRRWVTLHGFALNVDARRDHFAMIRPCGEAIEIVSLSDLTVRTPSMLEAERAALDALSAALGDPIEEGEASWLAATSH
ncbi:MAG: lipoyl(octanoyl) transferase LipB [Candidatus Bipolaricaulota bacterium]|nr:MAG: lipoyl(octanoyl) transferase LipB [Candidatus Bipolaricaulota bacterium]